MSFKEWNRKVLQMNSGEKRLFVWNLVALIIIFVLVSALWGCENSGVFISNIEVDKI